MNEARSRAIGGEPLTTNRGKGSIMAYSRFNHPSRVVKSLAAVALIIVLLIRGQQAPKPAEAEIYGPPIPDSITYNEEFCTPIFVQAVKATLPELKLGQLSRKTGFASSTIEALQLSFEMTGSVSDDVPDLSPSEQRLLAACRLEAFRRTEEKRQREAPRASGPGGMETDAEYFARTGFHYCDVRRGCRPK